MRGARILGLALGGLLVSVPTLSQSQSALIVGGGWGPEGTQVSIEAHVLALQSALPSGTPVLFAAGSATSPTVQVMSARPDEASALLGMVFDRPDNLGVRYRPSRVPDAGRASKQVFLQALATAQNNGPTIVFAVGHGAPATEDMAATLELWGPRDRLTVPELAEAMDTTPKPQPVALVLGQCHSGAFTDLIFVGADPLASVADPVRCVLAAVPADREAAGCTPDINDPGAKAYIAAIAYALQHPELADFDKDRQLSLAEADTWARIHDRTVDVPVASSEAWLDLQFGERAPDITRLGLKDLLALANPNQTAVLQSVLPAEHRGQDPRTIAAVHETLRSHALVLDAPLRTTLDLRDRVRRQVLDAVLNRWPELVNPYHERARALLAGPATEVVAFIRGRPELAQLRSLDLSIRALDNRLLELQRRAARLERWLRTAQRVANEAALRAKRNESQIAVLNRLEACEAMKVPRSSAN